MNIQSNINFGARVRMSRQTKEAIQNLPLASLGSSSVGAASAGMVGSSMSQTVGTGSNIVGSAFSAKASGLNSSGIVPAVVEAVTPHATPATIATSNNNPSMLGSLFSTIGDFFHSLGSVKVNVKHPN